MPRKSVPPLDHPWIAAILSKIDDHLRRHYGVKEFSSSPECILRMQVIRSRRDIVLSDGTRICAGDRVIALHLWSDHVPPFSGHGPTFAWAQHVSRAFDISLCELATYLATHREFDDIVGVSADVSLGSPGQSDQVARAFRHRGFDRVPSPRLRSIAHRLHRFGENILISLMVFARNSGALRRDTLWRERTSVFLSRSVLDRRFRFRPGGGAHG